MRVKWAAGLGIFLATGECQDFSNDAVWLSSPQGWASLLRVLMSVPDKLIERVRERERRAQGIIESTGGSSGRERNGPSD